MNKENKSTESSKANSLNSSVESVEELSEDMELISPGLMLREAREKLSLSHEDIAKKLNFRATLVADMEKDIFDPTLPETFNRGYLTSYAKLVSVDVEEILASYDVLGAASLQRSEMQSFSKQTDKDSEHSRVMWISYVILILLVGLTALWWYQDAKQNTAQLTNDSEVNVVVKQKGTDSNSTLNDSESPSEALAVISPPSDVVETKSADDQFNEIDHSVSQSADKAISKNGLGTAQNEPVISTEAESDVLNIEDEKSSSIEQNLPTKDTVVQNDAVLSRAVFTFMGDCWVNIYDATGERIAWGIKKSGYVMTIEGKAPLRITLGKPELASIVFNNAPVDMSTFNQGNIAKFTLPLTP
jgi:cytoskeleton protein RodZ